jgi:MYND finger
MSWHNSHMKSQPHLSTKAERCRIPIMVHENVGPMWTIESMVRWFSPGFTPLQILERYDQFMALNPSLAEKTKPDFSLPASDDKATCTYCAKECSSSKSVCGPCKLCFFRIYYCSKECQTAHWPTHKPSCARTLGVIPVDAGVSWANVMRAPWVVKWVAE